LNETKITDWEQVFEAEETGLISLINQSKTRDGLRACVNAVIHNIFPNDEYAEILKGYEGRLDALISNEDHIEEDKQRISELLREIKVTLQGGSAGGAASVAEDASAEQVFADICSAKVRERFQVLQGSIDQDGEDKLPFIFSAKFETHFMDILRQHILANMGDRCSSLIARAGQGPAAKEFIDNAFDDRRDSVSLTEAWKDAWKELTEQQEVPTKPKEEKKGLLGGLGKKKPPAPGQMTLEAWQVKSKQIKAANKLSAKIWAEICAESDAYHPPMDDDRQLLGGLFTVSPEGIEKQINAIRQIVEQGIEQDGNYGRQFASYAESKDTDLGLLAASYQRPDLFLTGEENALKDMLMGTDDAARAKKYRMVSRFLSDHM